MTDPTIGFMREFVINYVSTMIIMPTLVMIFLLCSFFEFVVLNEGNELQLNIYCMRETSATPNHIVIITSETINIHGRSD